MTCWRWGEVRAWREDLIVAEIDPRSINILTITGW